MGFQVLEHTADLKVRIFAKDKKKLFIESLKAFSRFLKGNKKLSAEKFSVEIIIKSSNLTSLLVDFLNEVLYLAYANKAVFPAAKFKVFEDNKLKGKLLGYKAEEGFDKDIKAATYHEVAIKKTDGNFEVVLIFDI